VLDAVELVIASANLEAAEDRWHRLQDPLPSTWPFAWCPAVGPAIRLVSGDHERVEHLVLAVRSAPEAQAVWREMSSGVLSGFPLAFVEG
jgi:hypothetical protein